VTRLDPAIGRRAATARVAFGSTFPERLRSRQFERLVAAVSNWSQERQHRHL